MVYDLLYGLGGGFGLLPAVIQDMGTGVVLVLGYVNEDSLIKTVSTGLVCLFSRGRKCLWSKGERSGEFQYVSSVYVNCRLNSLLIKVVCGSSSCHIGVYSCFVRALNSEVPVILNHTFFKQDLCKGSYGRCLVGKGSLSVIKKVCEEIVELVFSSRHSERLLVVKEVSDLWFHVLGLLVSAGMSPNSFLEELKVRFLFTGYTERLNRT